MNLVGDTDFELVTSAVWRQCSNQLSQSPDPKILAGHDQVRRLHFDDVPGQSIAHIIGRHRRVLV